jgi:hypothetical protein
MINSDEIITHICLILSFINISIWFYVYIIDDNIIQYLIYIFSIFILLFITLIIYISDKKKSYSNIIVFNEFYYIRIGLIILNLICYSFYIKYFLKDKSNIKKGGGFIEHAFINQDLNIIDYKTYFKEKYIDLYDQSEEIARFFVENYYPDNINNNKKEIILLLFINSIIRNIIKLENQNTNDDNIKINSSEFYRILYNFINDEILFTSYK